MPDANSSPIRTCPICRKNYFGTVECPNCGMQEGNASIDPAPQAPSPPAAPQPSQAVMFDPVAVFIWEMLRQIPNGQIRDAIDRTAVDIKLGDGALRIQEPELFHLAIYCQKLSDKIHLLRRAKA